MSAADRFLSLFDEQGLYAPARVLVGRDAKLMAFLRSALPLSWFDAILMHEYGIPRHPAPAREPNLQPSGKAS